MLGKRLFQQIFSQDVSNAVEVGVWYLQQAQVTLSTEVAQRAVALLLVGQRPVGLVFLKMSHGLVVLYAVVFDDRLLMLGAKDVDGFLAALVIAIGIVVTAMPDLVGLSQPVGVHPCPQLRIVEKWQLSVHIVRFGCKITQIC